MPVGGLSLGPVETAQFGAEPVPVRVPNGDTPGDRLEDPPQPAKDHRAARSSAYPRTISRPARNFSREAANESRR
jgi:hypothetical protein